MRRYRVNQNVGDLKHGELIEVDHEHPYWQRLIAAKTISEVVEQQPAAAPAPRERVDRPDPTRVIDQDHRRVEPAPSPLDDQILAATGTDDEVAEQLGVSAGRVKRVRKRAAQDSTR